MFCVMALKVGRCIACDKETECFVVEGEKQRVSGLLCPQDFRKQVKVATAASAPTSPAIAD